MKVEKHKHVSLYYELRENNKDGRVIEELNPDRPLAFVYGAGRLIPGFERGIAALSAGDEFSFMVESSEAYGERREEMIIDVPISVFQKDGVIDESVCFTGNMVPMADSQGRRIDGVVNEIKSDSVRMDFNHPMAGFDLCFSGKIIEVRDATPEEIAGGHGSSCSSCGSKDSSGGCQGEC